MTERINAPRGTRDIVNDLAASFAEIRRASEALFEHYGYREITTPIFESADLFCRSVGDDTDIVQKEMYIFEDRKARKMALRPEGTASVVRAFIENSLGEGPGGVVRLFYNGPMFRYERPQAGRYRQFFQLGCELFGSSSPAADIEVIDVAVRLLNRLGISAETRLNHLGCGNCKKTYASALREFFNSNTAELCPDCLDRLARNPLRILDCKVETCRDLALSAPLISHCERCSGEFQSVQTGLTSIGIDFQIDSSLVRGLGYYTGTVFEMVSKDLGAQDAVLGGGRYDELVESMGGKPTPAVGFAAGIDRLAFLVGARSTDTAQPPRMKSPFILVISPAEAGADSRDLSPSQIKAIRIARILRRAFEGLSREKGAKREWIGHEITGRSLKAGLKLADKLGAAFALVLGTEEAASDTLLIRHMADGNQERISLQEVSDEELAAKIINWCRTFTSLH